ncbi:MAG: FHA domain-containing protein, partial [Candidatus Sericytochromatia bacterium]
MRKHFFSTTNNSEIKINFGTSILGRNPDNAISLSEPSLSSRHALVANYDEYVEIMDLQSSNGTFVNNKRIMPFFPVRIYSGDKLAMGKLSLHYQSKEDEIKEKSTNSTTLNTNT